MDGPYVWRFQIWELLSKCSILKPSLDYSTQPNNREILDHRIFEVHLKYVLLHSLHAKNISHIKFDLKLAVNEFNTTAIFEKMCKYVNGFEMAWEQVH